MTKAEYNEARDRVLKRHEEAGDALAALYSAACLAGSTNVSEIDEIRVRILAYQAKVTRALKARYDADCRRAANAA